jgi:hypothetical protein
MKTTAINSEIVNHAIDNMVNINEGINACDLHSKLFNEDYFIVGYYKAEQFLINGPGIFNAIEEIKEYEKSNFGEVNTDFSSSEKVANMYAYIQGEELLNNCPTVQKKWDKELTKLDIKKITKELKNQISE